MFEQPAAGGVAVEIMDLLDQLEDAAALTGRKAVPAAVVDVERRGAVLGKRRAGPPVIDLAAPFVADKTEGVEDAPPVGVAADLADGRR